MSGEGARGVESLPMVLIISIALGTFALTFGIRSMAHVEDLLDDQKAIESFEALVEHAYLASFGGVGSKQSFELDLPGSEILVRGRLVQLKVENEIRKSKILPLPIILDGFQIGSSIQSGSYILELQRTSSDLDAAGVGDYFLCMRRAGDGPEGLLSGLSPL